MTNHRRRVTASLLCLATAALGTVALSAPGSQVHAATVPVGFTDSPVASFSAPTTVQWLPDDRLVVLEKSGTVKVSQAGGAWRDAIDLDVCTESERGLLGIAADPAMLSNGYVYVFYTRSAGGTCVNRVSRFTMVGTTILPGSERVLLDNIASTGGNHNGGDLDVGSDGYLYVAIGDSGADPRGNSGSAGGNDAAQDRSILNGKIVRVTLDGSPAPGNPFTGAGTTRCAFAGLTAAPNAVCQEIYAYGLRNPYRIAFDRNGDSDRFFINDVGQSSREEVDEGARGANYGWPVNEGQCRQGDNPPCTPAPGYTGPVTDYGRSYGSYVTGGAFVPNGLWPEQYDGGYLFGDGGSGNIWLREADGSVDYDNPFITDVGGLTDMTFGFDTNGNAVLYYVTIGGELRAVTAPPSNSPSTERMAFHPLTPERAYDTEDGTGVVAGKVFNGSTRAIDLDVPAGARAALVNLTIADTSGPGYLRTWVGGGARPDTSSVNADAPGGFVANAVVVPLDDAGRFVVEAATTARVVVDLMGYFSIDGATDAGRLVALDPERVVDTREAAGVGNAFTRTGDEMTFYPWGVGGSPSGAPAEAVVVSIGAIAASGPGGFVGAYPAGSAYAGTSNVNVLAGDVRANTVVVPLGDDSGVSLELLNVDDVVIDLVGYFTADGAPTSNAGQFRFVAPERIVDTRDALGMRPLGARNPRTVDTGAAGSAILQNVTVTETSAAGWLATYPGGTATPDISTLNFVGPNQTRAVLAFTKVSSGDVTYESLVPTDVVVDLVGIFT